MTCIAAIEVDGGAWIGSDSYIGGDVYRDVLNGPKWFVRGPLVIASSGGLYAGQVAEYGPKFRAQRRGEPDQHYLAVAVVDPIRVAHLATNADAKEVSFLIAYNGGVYVICTDYGIYRPQYGYAAAGAGEQFALGSLASPVRGSPQRRLITALKASAKHASCVTAPFHTLFVPALPTRPPKGTP